MWNWYFPVEIIGEKYRFSIFIYVSILSIILGWDGLGLISYCLVIYYIKIKSFTSGIVTILLNRLGDIGLLLIIGLITYYGRWNLSFYKINEFIIIFILLTAFTKSAQSASFFSLITNSNNGSCFVFSSFINFGYSLIFIY